VDDQVQANRGVVRRFLEEFLSCGDPSLADQVLAPEFVDHKPSTPGLPGRENVKRSVGDWCAAFPDTRTAVDDLVADLVGPGRRSRWCHCPLE
jgi:predicted SnoaL-like aldol condensation-catalyzing enzyme